MTGPPLKVDRVGPAKWRWTIFHPRSGMRLRTGLAGTKRKAHRKGRAQADRWVELYGHLEGGAR